MPIYYLEVNIICLVILLIIMEKIHNENKNLKIFNIYRKLLISIILLSIFDLFAGVFRGTMFPISNAILKLSNTLYLFFGILSAFYFNEYISTRMGFIKDDKIKIMRAFPVLVTVILLILNIFKDNLFYIDEFNLYHRGNSLVLYYIICSFYFINIIINLILTWKREYVSHQELKRLGYFTFIPILALIIQVFNYGITLAGVGFTISALMIFLDGEKNNSTIDVLTGINNRRAFNIAINKMFNDSNTKMFLMLLDANDFKKINDDYGHLVGDKALIEIAELLRKAIKGTGNNYFLGRFGGDEFIIMGKYINENSIEELIKNIKQEEEYINKRDKAYRITMSIGYSIKNNSHLTVDNLIEEADAKMYQNKKEFKRRYKSKKVA